MSPRFFVDENLLPVGRSLANALPGDVVHPGHRDLPQVPLGTDDVTWLTLVGRQGLIVITRDKRIRNRPAERLAAVRAGARLICLTGGRNLQMSEWLDTVTRAWPQIEQTVSEEGPWAKALSNNQLRPLRL